jgi:hypothetical protein
VCRWLVWRTCWSSAELWGHYIESRAAKGGVFLLEDDLLLIVILMSLLLLRWIISLLERLVHVFTVKKELNLLIQLAIELRSWLAVSKWFDPFSSGVESALYSRS